MQINRLTVAGVNAQNKPGLYADGLGLYLQVAKGGSKSWIFRYMLAGKPRKMGLGSVHTVPLKLARERAAEQRLKLLDADDPIDQRKAERLEKLAASATVLTFKEASERYIKAHAAGWKNAKHGDQWKSTLETYAWPVVGALHVAKVEDGHISQILDPIWATKNETASRLRGRIESILDWARVKGFRPKHSDNPARWKGHLDKLLPKPSKVKKVRPQPALPYTALPGFMEKLRGMSSISARALEFTILTAARTQAITGATLEEIDFDAKLWTVPGSRQGTKLNDDNREHRVPLCDRAIEILRTTPREKDNPHLFTGGNPGKGLSTAAMAELLKGFDLPSDTPGRQPVVHGFRSTFRDWAAEQTSYPNEMLEMALAHTVSDKTEAAYRRGDLMEKRRRLMSDWAAYCASPAKSAASNITPIRAQANV